MNPEKTVKIAVIGCGARAHVVVNHLLREGNGRIEIGSLHDPDREMMTEKARLWNAGSVLCCNSYQEAIAAPGIEWVMVCSPNCAHKEHILAAFAAGKHVFAEKPLATAMEECRTIHAAHQQSGRLFATGFVLRYAPLYLKVRELLNSGRFGYIVAIDASESIRPEHGGLIMAGWRRHRSVSGPHLLEKCCHDLDLLNWFAGALPVRAAAFGGRNFFISANAKISRKYGDLTFQKWSRFDPHTIGSPFTDDTDLMDNTVSILEFGNQVRAAFFVTMSNAIPERRMFFSCSEGTLKVDLYTGEIQYRTLGDEGRTTLNIPGDGHGGGDAVIAAALAESMLNHTAPQCGGDEGLRSTVVALALDEAARSGVIYDLKPVWKSLNVDPTKN